MNYRVAEKTHHINAKITGPGAFAVVKALKRVYPDIVITEDDNDLVFAEESDWFSSVEVTPAEYLRLRRENVGFTQAELSEKTGIAVPNISAMENGARSIGAKSAKALAEALDCPKAGFIA